MQQFFISKTLAEDMAGRVDPRTARQIGAMCWYGHWVPLAGGGFTMLMEVETRYCMLFHNLSAKDYQRFGSIFAARLWREVLALCQTKGPNRTRLGDLVKSSCAEMQFGLGLDYGMSNDVYAAARRVQGMVEELGGYPTVGATEFGLGIKLNQEALSTSEEASPSSALDAFRMLWLQKLERITSESTITAVNKHWPDNVIELAQKKPSPKRE